MITLFLPMPQHILQHALSHPGSSRDAHRCTIVNLNMPYRTCHTSQSMLGRATLTQSPAQCTYYTVEQLSSAQ
jgi:hypothetical protein